ncbi:hypothetical protein QTH89_24665 [Variovorax sp. J22G21]|uniref:hypothetical protein n=1 Tax=Variovorax fucosicus TaxID=3053517 RepID=UPI0025774FA2|nr:MULTISPECIES: hypothetical protein [unclassified Variovorax]MDM0039657.1 hypothetical protein [Variovorax sp. J22R193]MDM0064432.1 hypothetical protein [Variovorax sp. J22G21]
MALTRDNWPSRTAVRTSLAAQFALPPLPPPIQDWFAWCRRMGTESLVLEEPNWRDGESGVLTGWGAVDVPGLLAEMEGYRFILNQKASTPEHLVWSDAVDTGKWQTHWVVLQNADGDPLIGDIGRPEVPVLWDRHGSGRWSPQPLFPSLQMLMERIEVYVPPSLPGDDLPTVFYTVHLTDLGEEPLRVLAALKAHPHYNHLAGASLLKLKHQLPLQLLDDSPSVARKDSLVCRFEALGARVKVVERVYRPD